MQEDSNFFYYTCAVLGCGAALGLILIAKFAVKEIKQINKDNEEYNNNLKVQRLAKLAAKKSAERQKLIDYFAESLVKYKNFDKTPWAVFAPTLRLRSTGLF